MQQHILKSMNKQVIVKYVTIRNNTVSINGAVDFSSVGDHFLAFAKSIYKNYGIKYSKYFKMDNLSKLGFLASEVLLINQDLKDYKPEEIALIIANSSASLSTDYKYQNTLKEIPSPAVFVYTLANIVIGEICIRNDFKGESIFFIQDKFDTNFISDYVHTLLETTNAKVCITGWLEIDIDNNYNAFLCLVKQGVFSMELTEENLDKIYIDE